MTNKGLDSGGHGIEEMWFCLDGFQWMLNNRHHVILEELKQGTTFCIMQLDSYPWNSALFS